MRIVLSSDISSNLPAMGGGDTTDFMKSGTFYAHKRKV